MLDYLLHSYWWNESQLGRLPCLALRSFPNAVESGIIIDSQRLISFISNGFEPQQRFNRPHLNQHPPPSHLIQSNWRTKVRETRRLVICQGNSVCINVLPPDHPAVAIYILSPKSLVKAQKAEKEKFVSQFQVINHGNLWRLHSTVPGEYKSNQGGFRALQGAFPSPSLSKWSELRIDNGELDRSLWLEVPFSLNYASSVVLK